MHDTGNFSLLINFHGNENTEHYWTREQQKHELFFNTKNSHITVICFFGGWRFCLTHLHFWLLFFYIMTPRDLLAVNWAVALRA